MIRLVTEVLISSDVGDSTYENSQFARTVYYAFDRGYVGKES